MEVINAGEIVEHAVRRQNINISELSRRMKVNRRTLYNWFQQKKLHLDVVCAIGQVINYDFSKEFEEEFYNSGIKLAEPDLHTKVNHQHISQESIYYWMEKYIALLEDYKRLLQTTRSEDFARMNRSNEQEW